MFQFSILVYVVVGVQMVKHLWSLSEILTHEDIKTYMIITNEFGVCMEASGAWCV